MVKQDSVFAVSQPQFDARILVFRRIFSMEADLSDQLQVDAYCIVTTRYLIICDTMPCPEDAAKMWESIPAKLKTGRLPLVINSHADWDHVWGNSYFCRHSSTLPHDQANTKTGKAGLLPITPIIAHTRCIQRFHSHVAQQELREYQQRSQIFCNVVLTPPTLSFDSHLTINGGDITAEVFHAPGHCCDHLAIWLPALHVLLAFDAVEPPFPTIENCRGVMAMSETLKHFYSLHPHHVLCSHGETTNPAIIQQNVAYLQDIEKRCRMFLASGQPTSTELEQASALIDYPYDKAIAQATLPPIIDHSYYRWAHDHNVRSIFQWLMG